MNEKLLIVKDVSDVFFVFFLHYIMRGSFQINPYKMQLVIYSQPITDNVKLFGSNSTNETYFILNDFINIADLLNLKFT